MLTPFREWAERLSAYLDDESNARADRYEEIVPERPHRTNYFLCGLLVIGVILMSFVVVFLFSFDKAPEKARQSQCLNHQRQIAAAMLIYAQEHGDTLPSADKWMTAINIDPQVL